MNGLKKHHGTKHKNKTLKARQMTPYIPKPHTAKKRASPKKVKKQSDMFPTNVTQKKK